MKDLYRTLLLTQQVKEHLEKSMNLTDRKTEKTLNRLEEFKIKIEESENDEETCKLLENIRVELKELKEVYEKVDSELDIVEVLLADPSWETDFGPITLIHEKAIDQFLKLKTKTIEQINILKNSAEKIERIKNKMEED